MLSYLSNRHYHTLTQLLPPQLRVNQPQKIYYRTNINQTTLKLLQQTKKVTHKTLGSSKKVQNTKKSINKNYKINACPICQQPHISVQYHGHRHICIRCRNYIRDQFGHQIKIFLNENDEIVCLGVLPKNLERKKISYYLTDHTKLEIMNRGVYATYAGRKELVLILKEDHFG